MPDDEALNNPFCIPGPQYDSVGSYALGDEGVYPSGQSTRHGATSSGGRDGEQSTSSALVHPTDIYSSGIPPAHFSSSAASFGMVRTCDLVELLQRWFSCQVILLSSWYISVYCNILYESFLTK